MTNHRDLIAAGVVLLGVVLFVWWVAWPVHRKHVGKASWDGTEDALGKAFAKRKREERDWEAEHG